MASKAYCTGALLNCPIYMGLSGGGEGNRTPVRKPIRRNFSGCRPSFAFPRKNAEGQAYFQGISLIKAAVREQLPPLVHR